MQADACLICRNPCPSDGLPLLRDQTFQRLNAWLRNKGINTQKRFTQFARTLTSVEALLTARAIPALGIEAARQQSLIRNASIKLSSTRQSCEWGQVNYRGGCVFFATLLSFVL
jgi:hypothetical protein